MSAQSFGSGRPLHHLDDAAAIERLEKDLAARDSVVDQLCFEFCQPLFAKAKHEFAFWPVIRIVEGRLQRSQQLVQLVGAVRARVRVEFFDLVQEHDQWFAGPFLRLSPGRFDRGVRIVRRER